MKVLRCTCTKCSKLLIGKEKNKHLLKLSADERWQQVFTLASKVKRCGDDNEDGCGAKQPSKIRKEGLATVIAEWESIDGVPAEDTDALSIKITGEMALKILRRISDEDVAFMGFSPVWSRPDWMICEVFSVPPQQSALQ